MTTKPKTKELPVDESFEAAPASEPQAVGTENPAPAPARNYGPDAAVSLALVLMMNAPGYCNLFLAELEWVLFPPILTKQYKLYFQGKKPVGFVAWARVGPEVDARLKAGNARLKPHEWASGDIYWVLHLISPFGGGEGILEDVKKTVLAGKVFRIYRLGASGATVETLGGEA